MRTIIAVCCALVVVALGLVFGGDHGSSAVDDAALSVVDGWPRWVLRVLVLPTEPYVLVPVLAVVAGWCLRAGRQWDAVFAVAAPVFAVVLNTWVLKPVFDRWKNDTLVYPSGHTVSMVATVAVVWFLVGRGRTIIAAVGAVLLVGVTLGMMGLGYHYVTDVAGGTAFAVVVVLAVRAAIPVDRHAIVERRE
jgi:membrane-associated phospholipid phosphatase